MSDWYRNNQEQKFINIYFPFYMKTKFCTVHIRISLCNFLCKQDNWEQVLCITITKQCIIINGCLLYIKNIKKRNSAHRFMFTVIHLVLVSCCGDYQIKRSNKNTRVLFVWIFFIYMHEFQILMSFMFSSNQIPLSCRVCILFKLK